MFFTKSRWWKDVRITSNVVRFTNVPMFSISTILSPRNHVQSCMCSWQKELLDCSYREGGLDAFTDVMPIGLTVVLTFLHGWRRQMMTLVAVGHVHLFKNRYSKVVDCKIFFMDVVRNRWHRYGLFAIRYFQNYENEAVTYISIIIRLPKYVFVN